MSHYFLLVFLYLFGMNVATAKQFKSSVNSSIYPHAHLPPCGKTYDSSEGFIVYKPFEQILPNERCSFTIGVQRASSYKVTVLHLGVPTNQPGSDQQLVLTGVIRDEPPALQTYRPDTIGSFNVTNSTILIVTFFSSQTIANSTGFALQYEVIAEGSDVSPKSSHHVFSPQTFSFEYSEEVAVREFILSTLTFLPDNSTYTGAISRIWYDAPNLSYSNVMYVYTIDITAASPDRSIWQLVESMDQYTQDVYIPVDDIALIIHTAGNYNFNSQFSVKWSFLTS